MSGRLDKPALCASCQQVRKVQMHHPDYAQPLLVEWLCKPCHAFADKSRRLREPAEGQV